MPLFTIKTGKVDPAAVLENRLQILESQVSALKSRVHELEMEAFLDSLSPAELKAFSERKHHSDLFTGVLPG